MLLCYESELSLHLYVIAALSECTPTDELTNVEETRNSRPSSPNSANSTEASAASTSTNMAAASSVSNSRKRKQPTPPEDPYISAKYEIEEKHEKSVQSMMAQFSSQQTNFMSLISSLVQAVSAQPNTANYPPAPSQFHHPSPQQFHNPAPNPPPNFGFRNFIPTNFNLPPQPCTKPACR